MGLDNKIVYEEENYFSIYQDVYWSDDRYEITIEERMVH